MWCSVRDYREFVERKHNGLGEIRLQLSRLTSKCAARRDKLLSEEADLVRRQNNQVQQVFPFKISTRDSQEWSSWFSSGLIPRRGITIASIICMRYGGDESYVYLGDTYITPSDETIPWEIRTKLCHFKFCIIICMLNLCVANVAFLAVLASSFYSSGLCGYSLA